MISVLHEQNIYGELLRTQVLSLKINVKTTAEREGEWDRNKII